MKPEDTVKTSNELCLIVCQEYRTLNLEGKDCTGKDCDACQLNKQAEIAFKAGMKHGIWLFAWWKDGVQYVGTSGRTLAEAYKELGIE